MPILDPNYMAKLEALERRNRARTAPQGDAYTWALDRVAPAVEPALRPLSTYGAALLGDWYDANAVGQMTGDPGLMTAYDPGMSETLPYAVALADDRRFGEAAFDLLPSWSPQDAADISAALSGYDTRTEEELSPGARAWLGAVGTLGGAFGVSTLMRGARNLPKGQGRWQRGTFGGPKAHRDPADYSVPGAEGKVDWPSRYGDMMEMHPSGEGMRAAPERTMWGHQAARAEYLEEIGRSREEIFDETGLWRLPGGKEWAFEIDDRGAVESINWDALKGSTANQTARLGDLIPGWEGFRYYPDMKDVEVTTTGSSGGVYERAGWRKGGTESADTIGVSGSVVKAAREGSEKQRQKALKILMHEVNHAIQKREGFAGQGAGVYTIGMRPHPKAEQYAADPDVQKYWELTEKISEGRDAFDTDLHYLGAIEEAVHELKPRIMRRYGIEGYSVPRKLEHLTQYEAYRREAGEMTSRLTESRLPLMGQARAGGKYPWEDLDVPEDEAILRPPEEQGMSESINLGRPQRRRTRLPDGRTLVTEAGPRPADPGPDVARPVQRPIPEGKKVVIEGPQGREEVYPGPIDERHGVQSADPDDFLDVEDEMSGLYAPLDESGHPRILFSGERSGLSPEQNAQRMRALREELEDRGIPYRDTVGRYEGTDEASVMVPAEYRDEVRELARDLKQESILEVDETGHGSLWFTETGETEPLGVARQAKEGERPFASTIDPRTGREYVFEQPKSTPGRRYGRTTIRDPQRKAYPGIYSDPRELAMKAEARVPPEDPALFELFGVTRADLARMAQEPGSEPGTWPGRPKNPKGSAAADRIMKPENARRLRESLEIAREEAPRLTEGMTGWYEMRPVYERLVERFGAEEGGQRFRDLVTYMGLASPGTDVMTEITRGTAANMMARQGRLEEYYQKLGIPEHARGADFPEDVRGVPGHAYHRSGQAGGMKKYHETGSIQSKEAKVPLYTQASMVDELGRQTDVPVGDSHWSRAAGLADARTAKEYKDSVSSSEMAALSPWWRDEVAGPAGYESVPAQANAWGLYSGETGVDTAVGVPKLELLAKKIRLTAEREGIPLEVARDRVIAGEAYAGRIDPELLTYLGLGSAGAAAGYKAFEDEFEDLEE